MKKCLWNKNAPGGNKGHGQVHKVVDIERASLAEYAC